MTTTDNAQIQQPRPTGGSGAAEALQVEDLTDKVPNIDSTLEKIDKALTKTKDQGCGCW